MLSYVRSSYVNNGYRIGPIKPPVPPEPEFELADLFAGESGFAWSGLPYYQSPAGTDVADWGNPVGLIPDATENGNAFTQPTVTARPVLQDNPPRLVFDGTDDLVETALPQITNGTAVFAGVNGIWIDDDFNHAGGGTFSIGPTSYTGGPDGILPILGDLIVGGCFVINRQLTTDERERVIRKLKSMGAPGVFELGPELVVNGDFSDGLNGWNAGVGTSTAVSEDNSITITNQTLASWSSFLGTVLDGVFLIDADLDIISGGPYARLQILSSAAGGAVRFDSLNTGSGSLKLAAPINGSTGNHIHLRHEVSSAIHNWSKVSVRKLELIP